VSRARVRRIALIVVAVSGGAVTVRAQSATAARFPASPVGDSATMRLVGVLSGERRTVWLAVHEQPEAIGIVGALDSTSVTLLHRGASRAMPLVDVDTVWVRDDHAKLWIVAAMAGGFAAGALGYQVGALHEGADDKRAQYAITGAVGGAVVLGLLGRTVGSLTPRWREVFARPPASR
jgi:hypothetical protein